MLSLAGQEAATIVGITTFGDTDALDQGGTVSIPARRRLRLAERRHGGVRGAVPARAARSQDELLAEVTPLVPSGFEAQTGAEFLDDQQVRGRIVRQVPQDGAPGVRASWPCSSVAFVIYNTFSVIVAQRLRELAVFAAVGATPKQIKRSLAIEGLLIGMLGSAIGVVVGLGLAFAPRSPSSACSG